MNGTERENSLEEREEKGTTGELQDNRAELERPGSDDLRYMHAEAEGIPGERSTDSGAKPEDPAEEFEHLREQINEEYSTLEDRGAYECNAESGHQSEGNATEESRSSKVNGAGPNRIDVGEDVQASSPIEGDDSPKPEHEPEGAKSEGKTNDSDTPGNQGSEHDVVHRLEESHLVDNSPEGDPSGTRHTEDGGGHPDQCFSREDDEFQHVSAYGVEPDDGGQADTASPDRAFTEQPTERDRLVNEESDRIGEDIRENRPIEEKTNPDSPLDSRSAQEAQTRSDSEKIQSTDVYLPTNTDGRTEEFVDMFQDSRGTCYSQSEEKTFAEQSSHGSNAEEHEKSLPVDSQAEIYCGLEPITFKGSSDPDGHKPTEVVRSIASVEQIENRCEVNSHEVDPGEYDLHASTKAPMSNRVEPDDSTFEIERGSSTDEHVTNRRYDARSETFDSQVDIDRRPSTDLENRSKNNRDDEFGVEDGRKRDAPFEHLSGEPSETEKISGTLGPVKVTVGDLDGTDLETVSDQRAQSSDEPDRLGQGSSSTSNKGDVVQETKTDSPRGVDKAVPDGSNLHRRQSMRSQSAAPENKNRAEGISGRYLPLALDADQEFLTENNHLRKGHDTKVHIRTPIDARETSSKNDVMPELVSFGQTPIGIATDEKLVEGATRRRSENPDFEPFTMSAKAHLLPDRGEIRIRFDLPRRFVEAQSGIKLEDNKLYRLQGEVKDVDVFEIYRTSMKSPYIRIHLPKALEDKVAPHELYSVTISSIEEVKTSKQPNEIAQDIKRGLNWEQVTKWLVNDDASEKIGPRPKEDETSEARSTSIAARISRLPLDDTRFRFEIWKPLFERRMGVVLEDGKTYAVRGRVEGICNFEAQHEQKPGVAQIRIEAPREHLDEFKNGETYKLTFESLVERETAHHGDQFQLKEKWSWPLVAAWIDTEGYYRADARIGHFYRGITQGEKEPLDGICDFLRDEGIPSQVSFRKRKDTRLKKGASEGYELHAWGPEGLAEIIRNTEPFIRTAKKQQQILHCKEQITAPRAKLQEKILRARRILEL